jgi:hypothetical protein
MVKTMFKRFLLIVVCLAVGLATVACTSETISPREDFKGVFSTYEYITEDIAIQSFVENEFKAIDYSVEYVNYTVLEDLTEEELNGLNYYGVEKEDITSAKKVKISYKIDNIVCNHNAYVMQFGEEDAKYRYYSPKPSEDEALTISYANYLFDKEEMSNVTVTEKTSMSAVDQDVSLDYSMTFRYSHNAIGFSYSLSSKQAGQTYSEKFDGAMLMSARGVRAYTLGMDDQYQDSTDMLKGMLYIGHDLENTGVVSELKQTDFLVFVRQGDKFVLREEIKDSIIKLVKEQEGASEVYSYTTTIKINGERITEMAVVMDAMVSGQRVKATVKVTFTKYGATSVSVPQEVIDMTSKY